MLTKVEIRTIQGALLSLPLQDISEGYVIAEINGLEPVKATVVSSSFALRDGAQYQSSRREPRNIVLKLSLEPDYSVGSVQDLRNRLYGFFMPKSQVTLSFFISDGLTMDILGRVESFESALFTKDPEVTISLICFDPDFYDPISLIINGNTTATSTEGVINYDGTIETGILLTMNVNRTLASFTINSRSTDDIQRSLTFVAPLIAGDVLGIRTVSGSKEAYLIRSNVLSSVLYGISPYSNWINLYPGDNYFRVDAVGAAIPYVIEYTNKFGGL